MPDPDSLWTYLISDDGQTIVALAIVGLAAVYLVWKLFWPGSSAAGCGGCQQCPASEHHRTAGGPLIELKAPPQIASKPQRKLAP